MIYNEIIKNLWIVNFKNNEFIKCEIYIDLIENILEICYSQFIAKLQSLLIFRQLGMPKKY